MDRRDFLRGGGALAALAMAPGTDAVAMTATPPTADAELWYLAGSAALLTDASASSASSVRSDAAPDLRWTRHASAGDDAALQGPARIRLGRACTVGAIDWPERICLDVAFSPLADGMAPPSFRVLDQRREVPHTPPVSFLVHAGHAFEFRVFAGAAACLASTCHPQGMGSGRLLAGIYAVVPGGHRGSPEAYRYSGDPRVPLSPGAAGATALLYLPLTIAGS